MPAPTQPTFATIQQEVLSLLDEAGNTPIGQLPSGTGGAPIEDTTTAVKRYLNQAFKRMARRAVPIIMDGTFTLPAGNRSFRLSQVVTPDGSGMFGVVRVGVAGSSDLAPASVSYLNIYKRINAPGTPSNFYRTGQEGIGIAPYPTAATNLTMTGFVVPADLVNDADTAFWLSPDLQELAAYYAAGRVAMKAMNDPNVGPRAQMWKAEYEEGEARLIRTLRASDPATASLFFVDPEVPRNG